MRMENPRRLSPSRAPILTRQWRTRALHQRTGARIGMIWSGNRTNRDMVRGEQCARPQRTTRSQRRSAQARRSNRRSPNLSNHGPEERKQQDRARSDRLYRIRLTNIHRDSFLIKQNQSPFGVTKNQAAHEMRIRTRDRVRRSPTRRDRRSRPWRTYASRIV
jgi:hypothetical protein